MLIVKTNYYQDNNSKSIELFYNYKDNLKNLDVPKTKEKLKLRIQKNQFPYLRIDPKQI
jgi:hypothetical protein